MPEAAFTLLVADPFAWTADWGWGLPILVLVIVIHVSGLALLGQGTEFVAGRMVERVHPRLAFVTLVGGTSLFAICLHGIEAMIWAAAYRFLGALPDFGSSVLYSLNAMTSYGHADLSLKYHWQLMGALEALNGWLLFGLTTAFLFAIVQKLLLFSRAPRTSVAKSRLTSGAL